MKKVFLQMGDEPLGEVLVDYVRGRETWMFQFDETALSPKRPMVDPAIANVRGPQFAPNGGLFGFLADAEGLAVGADV